jgi:hypothetical protein
VLYNAVTLIRLGLAENTRKIGEIYMLHGIAHTTGKVLLGAVGVTALAATANSVAIIAEAVRRASLQAYDKATGSNFTKTSADNTWSLKDLVPYSVGSWSDLGMAALKNVIVGTVALYTISRFYPAAVTHANNLLLRILPIQFTPNHIPLIRIFSGR